MVRLQKQVPLFIKTQRLKRAKGRRQNISRTELNNMDMRLGEFIGSFNGAATKYSNRFLVLEKTKDPTSKMMTVTAIAFASNGSWFEYKQQLFNMLIRT
ncbi:MAG: hypothetical protein CR994_06770 [Maribacter sp.]|nr:MAG: hypothetical protein CR994_06770 [Maribacter sp.]